MVKSQRLVNFRVLFFILEEDFEDGVMNDNKDEIQMFDFDCIQWRMFL